jgi:hypothetical protein
VARQFKFRKDDGRKKKRREGQYHWVEETTIIHELGDDGEMTQVDPESGGINEIARRVGDDLFSGKITEEEAKQRLSAAVTRLTRRDSKVCLMCGGLKPHPSAVVCDSCADDVEIETEFDFDGLDGDVEIEAEFGFDDLDDD